MSKTLLSGFTGGAIGVTPTVATEPWASSAGGTEANMTYQAAIVGTSGQSVQATGARDLVWTPTGSHWRLGMWVNRVSGTQTLGLAFVLLRSGTTNRADVFLRNQNGGQIALRAGAGGTTYAGQSALTIANGDVWWVELEYDATAVTLHLWEPGNTTTTPDDTFTSTTAAAVDNVRLFNPTGATGLTMRFGELWASDGEQIREGAAGPGTLTAVSNLVASDTEIIAVAKVANAATVRLDVDGAPGADVAPDEAGYVRATATDLIPDTVYAWSLKVDSVERATGTITTNPAPGGNRSVRFLWGSCFDTNTSGVFSLMAAQNPLFVAMLGDWGYQYITGGPNGNTSPTDVATVRAHREPVLAAAIPQGFFTGRSIHYTMSDCDGGGANADATVGGLATGAVQAAYRQQFAHPTLPLMDSGARSWVIGRVRFILTDETVAASSRTAIDDSAKSKLGVEQKVWFKAEIAAAAAEGQAVVWFGDGPWIEPAGVGSATYNSWARYNTERVELGTCIADAGMSNRLVRLHGDTHTLFYDDGTNNPWGGFKSASAAPIHTTAQPFGYPVSGGKYPTETTNGSRQYGVGQVTDDGEMFTLELWGYSSTNAAPAEVERFHALIDLANGSEGTLTQALPALTTAAVGSSATPAFAGTASATLPMLGQQADGTMTPPATGGTADTALPALSSAATGATTAPGVSGEVQATFPAMTGALSGSSTTPAFAGMAASALPLPLSAAAGVVSAPGAAGGQVATELPALTASVIGVVGARATRMILVPTTHRLSKTITAPRRLPPPIWPPA